MQLLRCHSSLLPISLSASTGHMKETQNYLTSCIVFIQQEKGSVDKLSEVLIVFTVCRKGPGVLRQPLQSCQGSNIHFSKKKKKNSGAR